MTDDKKEWRSIRIAYSDGDWVDIKKEDLDRIAAISDVIDALQYGKALVEKLKNVLK